MKELNELVGKKVNSIFLQLRDMVILNFGDEIEYSLHISSFVRVSQKGKILFTSSDVFFNTDYTRQSDEDKSSCLIDKNIEVVRNVIVGELIINLDFNELGDVKIYLSNDCKIEIITDCLFKDYDYFRFIKFFPHYSETDEFTSRHFIFTFDGDKFIFKEDS